MATDIISAATLLFLLLDPLGNIPIFLSVLEDVAPERRTRVLLRELVLALLVLLAFLFFGQYLLGFLQLSEHAIRIAGGTEIGADCTLAGGVGIVGHIVLCDGVHVTGMTMVTHSITEPGSYSSGTRMAPTGEWRRNAVNMKRLDALARRVAALEKRQGNK